MSSDGGHDKSKVYAAAQGRTYLQNELKGKSNDWVREFAGLTTDPDVLDFLNHYCAIYEARGEDFLDTAMAKEVIRNSATEEMSEAFRVGNVSQLQGMVGLTKNEGEASDALDEIVNRLMDEGTVATIVGPPGTGKTATTLDVTRSWVAKSGGYAFGNTPWDGFDETFSTDLEMFGLMGQRKGQCLGVLDETAHALTGRGASNKEAEAFANRATLVRKQEDRDGPHAKRGSLLLVAHNFDRLNAPARRMTTLYIQKYNRSDPSKVRLWKSEGGEDGREEIGEFGGLTDTRESYDEHDSSEFRIVLEDDDGDDGDDVDPEAIAKDKDRETVIRILLNDPEASQADAAAPTDYGRGWAGEQWRAWKKGEYRDLVPVPEPLPDHVAEDEVRNA